MPNIDRVPNFSSKQSFPSAVRGNRHISLSARWTHAFHLTAFLFGFLLFHTSSCASRLEQLPHVTAQLGQMQTPAALKPERSILSIRSRLR